MNRPEKAQDTDLSVTAPLVLGELRSHDFAILSTVDPEGRPDSAAVSYGMTAPGDDLALYVMTRRHLRKARNIEGNPWVSLVVPLPRRLLWFVPPPTIQLHGRAEVVGWQDPDGNRVFRRFWLGRRILTAYAAARDRGETRVCFLKIRPDRVVRTYAVGYSALEMSRRMESAAARVELPVGTHGWAIDGTDARQRRPPSTHHPPGIWKALYQGGSRR